MSNFGNRNTGFFATSGSGGGGEGTVTSVAELTLGTTGTDLTSTVANSTTTPVITLNVPDASTTARGVITIGEQTMAGGKTFTLGNQVAGWGVIGISDNNDTEENYAGIKGEGLQYSKGVWGTAVNDYGLYGTSTNSAGVVAKTSTGLYHAVLGDVDNNSTYITKSGRVLINTNVDNTVDTLQVNGTISATNLTSTGQTTYVGTPTWTGGTPSGATNFTYSWTQSGKCVTLRINLIYATPATATAVSIPLPSGAPTPQVPTGFSGNGNAISYGNGMISTNATPAVANANAFCCLRINATSTGFEIYIQRASAAYGAAFATIQYFIA